MYRVHVLFRSLCLVGALGFNGALGAEAVPDDVASNTADAQSAAEDGADAREAKRLVERFHEALLDLMQSEAEFDDRVEEMRAAVLDSFSLGTTARVSIGAGWRQMEGTQRSALHAALLDLIATTYADRFSSYSGQRFVTVESDAPAASRIVVRTELVRPEGDNVSLVYHLDDDGIFNVIANGVSDLSLRRAQYSSVFRRDGFDGLLEEIEKQTAALRQNNGDE